MSIEAIYQDKLITVTKNEIIFHNYYFPTGKDKIVKLENLYENKIQLVSIDFNWLNEIMCHTSS